jgi:hypothetical protein
MVYRFDSPYIALALMNSIPSNLLRRISPDDGQVASSWSWLLPEASTPIYSTVFGDLFLRGASGNILFLNTLDAVVIDAADDESDLLDQLQVTALREDVLMHSLAAELSASMRPVRDDECYSIIIPPTLAGTLSADNFHILPLATHMAALSDMQRQVIDDPVGTKYRVEA